VIENAIRDLKYHAELLSLLRLPPQQDRDAVMILHLGGVFGDKAATLDRFRENHKRLSQGIKDRLVLENDDVSWSVHDLLPICEELDIPMVLDFHHHNIIFDADKIREGTQDIMHLYPRILATWERKKITPKMHYSEPTPSAITGRQRRKHNPRVAMLPPCPPTMDLMIEAKDKEQAVFELMRTYKLPGFDTFNDMIPHARKDDNKPIRTLKKKSLRRMSRKVKTDNDDENENELLETPNDNEDPIQAAILYDDIGMGGPDGRVYWPPGMEHWLRPMKKVIKPKRTDVQGPAPATPVGQKRKAAAEASTAAVKLEDELLGQHNGVGSEATTPTSKKRAKAAPKRKSAKSRGKT
jgi:UV DNA damage endonuclease